MAQRLPAGLPGSLGHLGQLLSQTSVTTQHRKPVSVQGGSFGKVTASESPRPPPPVPHQGGRTHHALLAQARDPWGPPKGPEFNGVPGDSEAGLSRPPQGVCTAGPASLSLPRPLPCPPLSLCLSLPPSRLSPHHGPHKSTPAFLVKTGKALGRNTNSVHDRKPSSQPAVRV